MTEPSNPVKKIGISGLSCQGLLKIREFYVKIIVNERLVWQTSHANKSNNPKWNEDISFNITDGELMKLQVYRRRLFGGNKLVGELERPLEVSALLDRSHDDIERNIVKRDKKSVSIKGIIRFKSQEVRGAATSDLNGLSEPIKGANSAAVSLDQAGAGGVIAHVGAVMAATSTGIETFGNIFDAWKPLVDRIELVVKAVATLSEISPYAQMAWSVLSPPLNAVIAQHERDEDIMSLLGTMNKIYQFLVNAGPLAKIEVHQETAKVMFQQTMECAWFIREYTSRGFAGRMLKSLTTNHDSVVKQYHTTFEMLHDAFRDEAALNTELTVVQISAKTEEMRLDLKSMATKQLLDELPYASGQSRPNQCLSGTRGDVISDIIDWFSPTTESQKDAKRMYWLHGVAGCGKSTIARTVDQLLRTNRRCVSFYFNASHQADVGSHNLFSTLSRDLADINERWKAALVGVVKESTEARKSKTIQEQFENLITQPARAFDSFGPILIIIDAVDECGSVKEREPVLQALKQLIHLPDNFRFLITSRAEADIVESLQSLEWVRVHRLDHVDKLSVDHDIEIYVKDRLRSIQALRESWDESWVQEIVIRSGQLFQWAFTACEFIKGQGQVGNDPLEQLKSILQSDDFGVLDHLYRLILDKLCSFELGDTIHRRYQTIMGRMLSLYEPLPLESLSALYYDEEDKGKSPAILSPLGSLLRGVGGGHEPIQPLHASFIDFLLDEKRSGKYWVNVDGQRWKHADTLIREMETHLKFNICKLPTSYQLNRDIKDLDERVKENMPLHVSYACRYWGDHLAITPVTEKSKRAIGVFLRTKLLFWLESLSLIGKANTATAQLSKLQDWLPSTVDDELKTFVAQALLFTVTFGGVIEQSVPHIYISALPFVPRDSVISKAFLKDFQDPIDAKFHKIIQWPTSLLHIDAHSEVCSVAFSPDGNRVVSGSWDSTVRIWNAHTGELVAGPFHGHHTTVWSVGFSPDGNCVVSGSWDSTVRIWNAHTGELVAGPFHGHNDAVSSVGFSPDGNRVVSGSSDKTVRIWNAHTGELVAGPFHGHDRSVSSVGFSPDGNRVVSGSSDSTVRIWNAHTGELVAGPFYGHDDSSWSVGFSPDGNRIVSSMRTQDNIARIWNAYTGEQIGGLFQADGYDYVVESLAFSPDGNYIVSGSQDKTVRIWNAHTGKQVAGPFYGHNGTVNFVGFSPDGNSVVSGSNDRTLRIWNVYSCNQALKPRNRLSEEQFCAPPSCTQATSTSYENVIGFYGNNNIASLYTDQSQFINGWMYGSNQELLFWVLLDYRANLWRANNTVVIGEKSIRYDFPCISHGTSWAQIYQPSDPAL